MSKKTIRYYWSVIKIVAKQMFFFSISFLDKLKPSNLCLVINILSFVQFRHQSESKFFYELVSSGINAFKMFFNSSSQNVVKIVCQTVQHVCVYVQLCIFVFFSYSKKFQDATMNDYLWNQKHVCDS